MVTWGASQGGFSSEQFRALGAPLRQLMATQSAFGALAENGRVVTWGEDMDGGGVGGMGHDAWGMGMFLYWGCFKVIKTTRNSGDVLNTHLLVGIFFVIDGGSLG